MDLEIILNEISQKERQTTRDITHMWNLKHDKNAKQKQIHRFVVAKGEEGEGKKNWEFSVTKYKLVYI